MLNSILLYNSGGGIGDSIQLIKLISTLEFEFKNAKLYYLSAHENHFNSTLKNLNCEVETLNLEIKYFGFRWWHAFLINKRIKEKNVKKFDLVIDFQSKIRNSLILKMIPHKHFISSCFNFRLSKPKLYIKKKKKISDTIIDAINFLYKKNCVISDFNLSKIDKGIFEESEKLLPNKNYVGLSITQGNVYRKKEWPLSNIIDLCSKLKQNNKIPVFLIEKKKIELKNKIEKLIPYALFPEHNSNMDSPALVTCLGKRLDFAVTIDNGVMHMLSLSKVPMISLFGPTNSEKFAPKYNKSIIIDSKKIYNTKDISAITVDDVLSAAKLHLNF